MVSPARTGASQRMLSRPGEPRLAERATYLSTIRRIAMQQVCQPLAIRPLKNECFAASGIDMEGLRVELAREGDDLLLGEGVAAHLDGVAVLQVFPVEQVVAFGHVFRV